MDTLGSYTGVPETVEKAVEPGTVVSAIIPAIIQTGENWCTGATPFEKVEVHGNTNSTKRGIGIAVPKISLSTIVSLEVLEIESYMVVG